MAQVAFTIEQVNRLSVLQQLQQRLLTNAQAADALGLSVRQVQRLNRRVEQHEAAGVLHGNAGRAPANKTPPDLRRRVLQLAREHYADYNFSHLADTLAEHHHLSISRETLRRWLRPLGLGRPQRRLKKHRRRRTRSPREGQLLLLDGSPHPWFGPQHPPCCLILASDDATGGPLVGRFQPTEDRDGCFRVCLQLFNTYGLPAAFYLDRASHFLTTRHGILDGEIPPPTQFQRARAQLAVALKFAHSPQARGRGERPGGSFQDRLVAEFQHQHIADLDAATHYLNHDFIPRYGRRFAHAPTEARHAWRNTAWFSRRGKGRGGGPFRKNALSRLLSSVTYLGKVRHKDEVYDREHKAIVDEELFEQVRQRVASNRPLGFNATPSQPRALARFQQFEIFFVVRPLLMGRGASFGWNPGATFLYMIWTFTVEIALFMVVHLNFARRPPCSFDKKSRAIGFISKSSRIAGNGGKVNNG